MNNKFNTNIVITIYILYEHKIFQRKVGTIVNMDHLLSERCYTYKRCWIFHSASNYH
jgi:hypothetical protein